MKHLLRTTSRGVALAAATALAATTLTTVGTAPAHAEVPAQTAAGWLATELTNGLMHNPNFGGFDDYGLTIDAAFAIDAIGGNGAVIRQVRTALAPKVGSYVEYPANGAGDLHQSAGPLAKALVFAQIAGADGTSYGGRNLVGDLAARVSVAGPIAGRIEDRTVSGDTDPSTPGVQPDSDYANVIGQAFAARGLTKAGSAKAASATAFLLQQQCSAGYFRLNFAPATASAQGCVDGDAVGSAPDTDVTALAVLQLAALGGSDAKVTGAIAKATGWLTAQQKSDGSFGGGPTTSAANANSTGVAAQALASQGACVAAGRAAGWVKGLQVLSAPASSPLNGELGAIAYDAAALAAAQSAGITDATSDQWRRATSQAAPAVAFALSASPTLAFTGPTGFQREGTTATLKVTGVAEGERVCVAGPGISGTRSLVAGGSGALTTSVVLPGQTSTPTYTLTSATGTKQVKVSVLGKAKLPVKAKKKKVSKGDKQVVKVAGLVAGEKVSVRVRNTLVDTGTANAAGVFKAKFTIKKKLAAPGRPKVVVTGHFPDLRKGVTYFRVTR